MYSSRSETRELSEVYKCVARRSRVDLSVVRFWFGHSSLAIDIKGPLPFARNLPQKYLVRLRYVNRSIFYKITKIVRALWLAERSVCMRVCKHGCDVKMFCFSRANHAKRYYGNFPPFALVNVCIEFLLVHFKTRSEENLVIKASSRRLSDTRLTEKATHFHTWRHSLVLRGLPRRSNWNVFVAINFSLLTFIGAFSLCDNDDGIIYIVFLFCLIQVCFSTGS